MTWTLPLRWLLEHRPELELTTVADDHAVFFRRLPHDTAVPVRLDGLSPNREYKYKGRRFRTLPRPAGERLATFATVNDLHIGESVCGLIDSHPHIGPVFRTEPGHQPYPEVMNWGAVSEMTALNPDVVLVKGDISDAGDPSDLSMFLHIYGHFGDKLHYVRGNHDVHNGRTFDAPEMISVDLPGVKLAMLDTTIERQPNGQVSTDQLEWLDELASRADRPVMLFGHHHIWKPQEKRSPNYFGINPDDSEKLIAVFARRQALIGYFAGHTHRNHVEYIDSLPGVPFAELACVKDFPGAWTEYRVFEGGVLQIMHRTATPEALFWSEKTRGMFEGVYPLLSFGSLDERCFSVGLRS